jgi:DNA repair ATPase RecN
MLRRDDLQARFDAADAADEDYKLIGTLGEALEALSVESAQLPLSEEDFWTLAERHAQLVEKMISKCRELKRDKQYKALTALGTALESLRAADVSFLPPAHQSKIRPSRSCRFHTLSDTTHLHQCR